MNNKYNFMCLPQAEVEESGEPVKCKDFLGILLTAKDDNGTGLTPMEIRNEVDTFLFEGMYVIVVSSL